MQYGTASYRVASTRLKTRPNRPTMHPYPMFSLDRSFIVVITVLNFVIVVVVVGVVFVVIIIVIVVIEMRLRI